jgi:F0F1-type ATP synthase gamma subunit
MSLATIKNQIKKYKNIYNIISSLKTMCSIRLKKLKILNANLTKNLEEIKENIIEKLPKKIQEIDEWVHKDYYMSLENSEEKNKFTINIFLFTDMSFCGNLNENNKRLIIDKKKNKLQNENNLIIGLKGERYAEDNIEYLSKLYNKNLNGLIDEKIKQIIDKNQKMKIQIKIHSYNNINQNIIFNDDNNYKNFYEKYLLKKIIVDFKHEECYLRFIKVSTAIKNTEELEKILETLYNKKRQEIITKDLLETISSSQTEESFF